MKCEYLQNNECKIATSICGFYSETTEQTCKACFRQETPRQENLYTLGLAVIAISKNGKKLSDFPNIVSRIKSLLHAKRVKDLKPSFRAIYTDGKWVIIESNPTNGMLERSDLTIANFDIQPPTSPKNQDVIKLPSMPTSEQPTLYHITKVDK